jgi:(S)-ureidoglycine-glyoxylate aminotransferase
MTNVTGVYVPEGVDGEACRRMREDFEIEIGTAFGPLASKSGASARWAKRHEAQGADHLGAQTVLRARLPAAGRRRGGCALAAWDAA